MIRWKLLIINIILLIAAGSLSFILIDLIETPYDFDKSVSNDTNKSKENFVEVPKIEKKNDQNLAFFSDIVSKELFRQDRKEYIVEKEGEKEEEGDLEEPNFIVRGITIFGDTYRAAIIEKVPRKNNPSRPLRGVNREAPNTTTIAPKIYKEGDEIDTSWIVKKIHDRRVEFCHGSDCFYVPLYKTYEDESYIPPKAPPPSTSAEAPIPGIPPQPTRSTDFSAEEFKRLIQQGGRRAP